MPHEKPTFSSPLSNVMARAGQKLRLECEVSGLPHPDLTWLHNGRPVQEGRDTRVRRGTGVSGTRHESQGDADDRVRGIQALVMSISLGVSNSIPFSM